jgi:hypothetical protein
MYLQECKLKLCDTLPESDELFCRGIRDLELQSFNLDLVGQISERFQNYIGNISPSTQTFVKDIFFTLAWVLGRLPKVQDFQDVLAIGDYVTRIHFNKPIGTFIFDTIFDFDSNGVAQSLDWTVLKDLVSSYEALRTHPAVIKFIKVISLAFSGGILETMGIHANVGDLWKMITETMTRIMGHTDFIAAVVDLVQFIGERISAFCVTRSWHSLVQTPTTYSNWVDKAFDLIDKSAAIPNPDAIGMDYHVYVNDITQTIADGEEIRRYVKSGDAKDSVASTLSRLRRMYTDIIIRDAAGEFRMAPFTMLTCCGSSKGKSSFNDTLKTHYAKMYNKPLGKGFIYYRTPAEPHWNGFKSCMWCTIIEDVAAVNPNTATSDPSNADTLLMIGNTGFSPPQAAIEDKGRTPFKCELVLASTNTKDLKAHCWFNNPQAIRRRYPYVVNAQPKEPYRKPGTMMLDPSKVPVTLPGHYPDLWDIVVEEVKVMPDETISMVEILVTDSIYVFIQHFNKWVSDHRAGQASLLQSMANVAQVELCPVHQLPSVVCCPGQLQVQGDEEDDNLESQGLSLTSKLVLGGAAAVGACAAGKFFAGCAGDVLVQDPSLIARPADLVSCAVFRAKQKVGWYFNNKVEQIKFFTRDSVKKILLSSLYETYAAVHPYLKFFILGVGFFAGLGLTWHFLRKECPELIPFEVQVSIDDVGVMPANAKEMENVWRKADYQPSEFLGRLSQSWSNLSLSKSSALVARNVVWCRTSHGGTKHSIFRAVCLSGHLYVVPNHVLPLDEYFDLQVIHENNSEGCNGNISFKMAQRCILRVPEKELAFFEINHMPGRRNISGLLPEKGFTVDAPGRMVVRSSDGTTEYIMTKRTHFMEKQHIEQFNSFLDVCPSEVERDTVKGECGSPVVVQQPNACVLAGIHILGGTRRQAVSVPIYREDYESALNWFNTPIVENDIPFLEGQNFTTDISPRCTARYIPDGTVQVFGSFGGFKRQPKSTAKDTPLTPFLLEDGRKREFAPAPMRGFTAVHIGLKSMVQKKMCFKEDVVKLCAASFARTIYKGLPDRFKAELKEPICLRAALNGVPGTKFVDSMNFGTSAGYPYNNSKRNHIIRMPADDIWQHPVELTPEIKLEVEECWNKMIQGISSAPVFMQHLKDEALPLRKVVAGKARLFMGGPMAWNVCVRMALLPFVRVMQYNKYLFECAPGTNATSIEWTRIYQYLTRYGVDRLIAGDFETFDKVMGSLVIMEAFRTIRMILTWCGATQELLNAVQVIAEDVAFAFCNFNGDLMRFFGSNPSGHPLTVIINCLVNSIYMRYCYHELNPAKEVDTFQENVSLITYGDDNAAGSRVDWFNHTEIARILSEVGIGYTMADKYAESVPFIMISEVSFLKRNFRYEPELNAYMATLDPKSIWKSLMIFIPSKTESPQKQTVDIVRSAVAEWFFHGREKFEEQSMYLRRLLDRADLSCYIDDGVFPTWEELKERFTEASQAYLDCEPETTQNILGKFVWSS